MAKKDILSSLAENARILEEEDLKKKRQEADIGAEKPIGTTKQELSLVPEEPIKIPSGPMDIKPGALPYTGAAISTARSLGKEMIQPDFSDVKALEKGIEQVGQLNDKKRAQLNQVTEKLAEESAKVEMGESINLQEVLKSAGVKSKDGEPPVWLKGVIDAAVAALPIVVSQAMAKGAGISPAQALYAGGTGSLAGLEFIEKRRKEERDAQRELEQLAVKSELEAKISERKLPGRMQEMKVKAYSDQINLLNEAIFKGEITQADFTKRAAELINKANSELSGNYVDLLKASLAAAKPKEFAPSTTKPEDEKPKPQDLIFYEGRYTLPVQAQSQMQKPTIDKLRMQASDALSLKRDVSSLYSRIKDGIPSRFDVTARRKYEQDVASILSKIKELNNYGAALTAQEKSILYSVIGTDPEANIGQITENFLSQGDTANRLRDFMAKYQKAFDDKITNFGGVVRAPNSVKPTREQMIEELKKGKK
jgi:hypothetical protein